LPSFLLQDRLGDGIKLTVVAIVFLASRTNGLLPAADLGLGQGRRTARVFVVVPVETLGTLALRLDLRLLVVPAAILAAAVAGIAGRELDVPVENLDDGGGGGGSHEADG